jgi:hypothetical protein
VEASAAGHRVNGDTAMTRRKGEITRCHLKRKWPHHVALAADKVRGLKNSGVIFCAAGVLPAPRSRAANSDPDNNPAKRVVQDEGKVQNAAHVGGPDQ